MTNSEVEYTVEVETSDGLRHRIGAAARGAVRGVSGTISTIGKTVVRRGRAVVQVGRDGAGQIADHAPETVHATQVGAMATTRELQKLPDSTLRWLAATSVGMGAGLYLAGKRRVVVAAGLVPAVAMGAAIALRPSRKPVAAVEVKA
jgi:hypothetical protein